MHFYSLTNTMNGQVLARGQTLELLKPDNNNRNPNNNNNNNVCSRWGTVPGSNKYSHA